MAKHIRVVLADDHFAIRQGIATLLSQESDFNIVGEAGDGLEAIDLVEQLKPDVLLTDLTMPNLNGFDSLRHLHKRYHHLRIIVLSMHTGDDYVAQALQLGAKGYILKNSTADELVNGVREVLKGRYYVSARFADKGIDYFLEYDLEANTQHEHLTRREREVLQLVAEGRTNVEISQILGIASRTVETHRANVMHKLDFHSAADLIRYAIRHGILPLED